ncbi:tetratricopeptide repeat protein [bacterium]|nr:tetratricopeptide repeat protein [bacterium]
MKRTLVGMLILAATGWAQPAKKVAMVLKVDGMVLNHSTPVMTGELWSSGDNIELTPGSKVTVLLLNKGERQEISGKGSLEVGADGLNPKGCSAKVLSSTQLKLAMNGENHRQIGGMVVRDGAKAVENSVFDRIEVTPQGIRISRPAAAGVPPKLKCYFLDQFYNPVLNGDLKTIKMPPLEAPPQSAFAPLVSGQKQGKRWTWDVPWPLEEAPKSYALEVFPATPEGSKLADLYTRLYHGSSQDQAELAAAKKTVAAWAKREPGTVGPAVYMANLLDEKGQLQEALEALKPALALQPNDPGLLQIQARLLVDLGRYADAAKSLKKSNGSN